MKRNKFNLIDAILSWVFLPVFLLYWGAVLIFYVNGIINSMREELNDQFDEHLDDEKNL